jgi:hypothetical protein
MLPSKPTQAGRWWSEVRLGLLGKQHLLALAETQLPELDSVQPDQIRFEVGSGTGSGTGSGSASGSGIVREAGADYIGTGRIIDTIGAVASMHLHAEEVSIRGGAGLAALEPVVLLNSASNTSRHIPVDTVLRRDASAELSWLQVASSMEKSAPHRNIYPDSHSSYGFRVLLSTAVLLRDDIASCTQLTHHGGSQLT